MGVICKYNNFIMSSGITQLNMIHEGTSGISFTGNRVGDNFVPGKLATCFLAS